MTKEYEYTYYNWLKTVERKYIIFLIQELNISNTNQKLEF